MILRISLRAKAGVPKTLMKQKLRLHSLYFSQNKLMLTESRGEFSDLHYSFRLRVPRNCSQPLHNVSDNSELNAFAKTSSNKWQDSHWLDKVKEDSAVNNWNIKMSVTYSSLTTGKWLFPCTANGT